MWKSSNDGHNEANYPTPVLALSYCYVLQTSILQIGLSKTIIFELFRPIPKMQLFSDNTAPTALCIKSMYFISSINFEKGLKTLHKIRTGRFIDWRKVSLVSFFL